MHIPTFSYFSKALLTLPFYWNGNLLSISYEKKPTLLLFYGSRVTKQFCISTLEIFTYNKNMPRRSWVYMQQTLLLNSVAGCLGKRIMIHITFCFVENNFSLALTLSNFIV